MALLRVLWSIGDANSWQLENVVSGWDAMERVQSNDSPHALVLLIFRVATGTSAPSALAATASSRSCDRVICEADDGMPQGSKLARRWHVVVRPVHSNSWSSGLREHLWAPNDKRIGLRERRRRACRENDSFSLNSHHAEGAHTGGVTGTDRSSRAHFG